MTAATIVRRPDHHPDEGLLLDYASGAMHEAAGVLIATHLALCPACRAQVAALEKLGGAMIDDLPPSEMTPGSLDDLLARLDNRERPRTRAAAPAPMAGKPNLVPFPLRDYLGAAGSDLHALPWRKMGGPVSELTLSSPGALETMRLLRIKAGAAVPRHTHAGTELVMVLAGGFTDHVGRYLRGDVSVCDGSLDHQPVADADGDCVCLSVTDAPLRFTGPLGPILNLFVRF